MAASRRGGSAGHRENCDRRTPAHLLPQDNYAGGRDGENRAERPWKRVQRPNAGRRARNHLNDRLHERGEGWCAGEEAWTPEVMVVRAGDDAEG